MARAILVFFLFQCLAAAQPAFTGLATNANGSKLWFSSRLRLRGSDSFAHAKMFTWEAALATPGDSTAGIRLLEQREAKFSFPPGGATSSTYHELTSASVSRDGTVAALTASIDCVGFTFCSLSSNRAQSTIYSAGSPTRTEPEGSTLSSNGQFVFLGQSGQFPKDRILNLATGASTPPFDRGFALYQGSSRVISNNGSLVQASGLRTWPTGEMRSLPVQNCTAINANATRAYCLESTRLNLLDIASGRMSPIFTARTDNLFQFDISESGDQLVVLEGSELWLVRFDGTGLRRLLDASAAVAEFVLSGDGNVVFVATADSRLLRIDIGAASTREIVPPTAATRLQSRVSQLVKGSVYEYRAASIPEISEVRLAGAKGAVFHGGPELVSFQVPFDAASSGGWPEFVLAAQPPGPFAASILPGLVEITDAAPFWYTQGGAPGAAAIPAAALHEDFRGPVTVADPARPGEIVHVYGGGFGPVDPAPPAGEAASGNPLSRTAKPDLTCLLSTGAGIPGQRPAEILYSGLAPGWIGLYQLDIRLPEIPAVLDSTRFPSLQCGFPGVAAAFGFLPFRTP